MKSPFNTLLSLILMFGSVSAVSSSAHKIPNLPDSLWESTQWISVKEAPIVSGTVHDNENNRSADGASWFIFNLINENDVKEVNWMTTGLGIYEIYVNGKLIGEEILKPGFTHADKTRRSFTYNVNANMKLRKGEENIFLVQVVPGWWGDKIITHAGNEGMKGGKTAFRGVLEVKYADGSVKYYPSDTKSWKACITGPLIHSGIFDGVVVDSRIPIPDANFTGWSVPEINTEFNGEILPSDGAEVYFREDLALSPVKAYVWEGVENNTEDSFGKVKIKREYTTGDKVTLKPGETLVVDFGQNAAAVPDFVFKGKEGTKLTFLPGEILNDGNGAKSRGMDGPEGSVHRLNLRIPDSGMKVEYIFDGSDGFVSFRPSTTFFGYRYASLVADDDVEFERIESIPVTSIAPYHEIGKIITGNKDVNQLLSNIRWGQLSNYLSVPTDCPQRNERLGWTADTQVFAETGTFFANTRDFFHKWMHDMRDTQSPTGAYPGVAPVAQYGADPTDYNRLGWSDAGVIVPWVVWKQFSDTAIINENWEAMEKYLLHLDETNYDHTRLTNENGNFQWADWLSYESVVNDGEGWLTQDNDGNAVLRPEIIDYWNYLSACYWLKDAEMMADMAVATDRDPAPYLRMKDKARERILQNFINKDGDFTTPSLNSMQTPALFALYCGILEGDAKENVKNRLRKNLEDHGNRLQTGFLGTSILMPVLSENDMDDMAYLLLLQRENPSWLYSIDNGATTIWERWDSYTKDKGMGPQGMNSFNHYAYGCVGEWIWKYAAGIAADPSLPGFKKIIMKPRPDKRLDWLEASYLSPQGIIESQWKYEGDKWIWNFSIPDGSIAEVTLPGEKFSTVYAPGRYTLTKNIP